MRFLCTISICIAVLIGFGCASRHRFPIIVDPYAYVQSNDGPGKPLERFTLDITGDGTPELFVGSNALRGTGGGSFNLFEECRGGYKLLGRYFSLGALRLEATKHGRYPDITTWNRVGGTEGEEYGPLITYSWNGEKYVETSRKEGTVRAVDLGLIDPTKHSWAKAVGWYPTYLDGCERYIGPNSNWVQKWKN